MKKNRILLILAALVVVLLVVVVVAKQKGLVGGVPAIKVVVEEAARRNIVETVSASGKIQSEVEVIISPDVAGEIIALPVKEGDKVRIGQLLVKIDPDIQQSNVERLEAALNTTKANLANAHSRLAQSEARLTNAKASYDRTKKLFDDKVVAQSEYDAAISSYEVARSEVDASIQSVRAGKYNVKSAEAGLKEGRKNLAQTDIFSPVNGTVSRLNYEKGERVVGTMQMQGSEIMTIADLDEMEVMVEVNENDIIRVGYNDTCDIEVDAYLGEAFKGVVTSIANSAMSSGMGTDQVTNFEVKVRILRESYTELVNEKQPDQSPFRPGMSATVDIRTRQVRDVVTVPIQAVTTRSQKDLEKKSDEDGDESSERKEKRKKRGKKGGKKAEQDNSSGSDSDAIEVVFVVNGGEVAARKVETGIQNNEFIVITSGLEIGDKVVTAPYRAISKKLNSGDAVEEVSEDDLYGGEDEESEE